MVDTLIQGATTKVRNQVAGYITRASAGIQPETESGESQEEGE